MARNQNEDPDFDDIRAGKLDPQDILREQRTRNTQAQANTAPSAADSQTIELTKAQEVTAAPASFDEYKQAKTSQRAAGLVEPIRPRYHEEQVSTYEKRQVAASQKALGQDQEQLARQTEREQETQQKAAVKQEQAEYRGQIRHFKSVGGETEIDNDGVEVPAMQPNPQADAQGPTKTGEPLNEPAGVLKFKEGDTDDPPFQGKDGRWKKHWRDQYGNLAEVDLEANREIHTDEQTGQRWITHKGRKIDIGADPNVVDRLKIKTEQTELERGITEERLHLGDARNRREMANEVLKPLSKPVEDAQKAITAMEAQLATAKGRGREILLQQIAEKRKVAEDTNYLAAKQQLDAVDAEIRTRETAIYQRELKSLQFTREIDKLKSARLLPASVDHREATVADPLGEWPEGVIKTDAAGNRSIDRDFVEARIEAFRSQASTPTQSAESGAGRIPREVSPRQQLSNTASALGYYESLQEMGINRIGTTPITDAIAGARKAEERLKALGVIDDKIADADPKKALGNFDNLPASERGAFLASLSPSHRKTFGKDIATYRAMKNLEAAGAGQTDVAYEAMSPQSKALIADVIGTEGVRSLLAAGQMRAQVKADMVRGQEAEAAYDRMSLPGKVWSNAVSFYGGATKGLGAAITAVPRVYSLIFENDPMKDRKGIQWADNVDAILNDTYVGNRRGTLAEGAGQIFGSTLSFLIPTGIAGVGLRAAGIGAKGVQIGSLTTTALAGAAINGADSIAESAALGLDEKQTWARFAIASGVGLTEAMGIPKGFERLVSGLMKVDRASNGEFKRLLFQMGKEAVKEMPEEVLQEGGTAFATGLGDLFMGIKTREGSDGQMRAPKFHEILADTVDGAFQGAVGALMFGSLFAADAHQRDRQRLRQFAQTIDSDGGYAVMHDYLSELRGKLVTARAEGREEEVFTLKDQIEQAQTALAAAAQKVTDLPPDVRDKAVKLIAPDADPDGLSRVLADNETLRFAAAEIGAAMRGVYLSGMKEAASDHLVGRNANAQAALDQLLGAHAVLTDLVGVLEGGKITQSKALVFDRLGLLELEQQADGSTLYRVTDDALPLFPAAMRDAVANDAEGKYNFKVTAGQPGAIANNLVKSGEDRLRTGAEAANQASAAAKQQLQPTPKAGAGGAEGTGTGASGSGNTFQVALKVALPGGAVRTQKVTVQAVDAAMAVQQAVAQARGSAPAGAQISVAGQPIAVENSKETPNKPTENTPKTGDNSEKTSAAKDPGEAFQEVLQKRGKDLAKLGITKIAEAKGGKVTIDGQEEAAPGPLALHQDTLIFQRDQIAALFRERQDKSRSENDALEDVLIHEIIHGAATRTLTEEEVTEIARTAPAALRKLASKAYAGYDELSEWRQGHELVRMVVEGRYRGTITEQIYQALQKILEALGLDVQRLPENDLLKAAADRVKAVLDAAEVDISRGEQATAATFDIATPQGGVRARGRWRVVEASELTTSDRPDYNQDLQRRNRDRSASKAQIAEIAFSLDPSRLGESATSDTGSPIINAKGEVLSGNGRTMALRAVYEQGGKKAGEYRRFVAVEAARLGIGDQLADVRNPVLVRETSDYGASNEAEFSDLSNRSALLGRSAVETAMDDARMLIDEKLIDQFEPGENGELLTASNRQFNRLFVHHSTDHAQLLKGDGSFAPELEGRVRRAVLAAILRNVPEASEAVTSAIERAEKIGLTRQINGLMSAAGRLLKLQTTNPDMDIAPDLAQALASAIEARGLIESGKARGIEDALGQGDLFGEPTPAAKLLVRELLSRNSAKAVRELLTEYARIAETVVSGPSLFGDEAPGLSPVDVLENIIHQGERERTRADAARGLVEALGAARVPDVDPRISKAFPGVQLDPNWNLPSVPHPLPDGHPLLQPTHEKKTATVLAGSQTAQRLGLPPGEYSRVQLHAAIKHHFLRTGIHVPNPVAWITAGGGGAGKSTFMDMLALHGDYTKTGNVQVNADEVRELLPEYQQLTGEGDGRASVVTHEESSELAKQIRDRAIEMRTDLTYDATMSKEKAGLDLIERLRRAGYTVKMVAVTIDPYEALIRAFMRAARSKRFVPPNVLLGAHQGFNSALPAYARVIGSGGIFIFDNTPQGAGNHIEVPVDDILSGRYVSIGERAQINPNAKGRDSLVGTRSDLGGAAGQGGLEAGEGAGNRLRPGDAGVSGQERPASRERGESERGGPGSAPGRSEATGGSGSGSDLLGAAQIHPGRLVELFTNAAKEKGPINISGGLDVIGHPNLFGEGLGIAREDMPQVPGEQKHAFLEFLRERGVKYGESTINSLALKPTQGELDAVRIGRLVVNHDDKGIFISRDNYVIDGHHRWGARVARGLAGEGLGIPVTRIDLPIREALALMTEFMEQAGIEARGFGPTATLGAAKIKDTGTLDLFAQPAVEPAAKAYVEAAKKNNAVTKADFVKAAKKDGLGQFADDLFAFAQQQEATLTKERQPRNLSINERRGRGQDTATGAASGESPDAGAAGEVPGTPAEAVAGDGGGGDRIPAGGTGDSGRSDGSERELAPEERNYAIPADVQSLAPSGNAAKFDANLAAIRILRAIEAEKRLATPDEKALLAKYSGWGWAGEYFNPSKTAYARQRGQLESLLTDEEFSSARASTLNAHYTALPVIRSMWKMARRLGFTGGTVLETSAGIGHYFGAMPTELAASSRLLGVELDSLTGRMLKALYPQAEIQVTGFEKARIPNASVDLAISNVPFGNFKVPGATDYPNLLIHDYFFMRGLDKVKPGGLVMFITSDGTLQKGDPSVRQMIAERADLVAAVRLPNNAFKENAGTEVTTDILILRKKDGTAYRGQPFHSLQQIGEQDIEIEGKTEKRPIRVNEYFAANPSMALGRHSLEGTMYSAGDYALVAPAGQNTAALLDGVLAQLPEGLISNTGLDLESNIALGELANGGKEGSVQERDGEFFQVKDGRLVRPDWQRIRNFGNDEETINRPVTEADRVKREAIAREWIVLRDKLTDLLALENDAQAEEADLRLARYQLNLAYDRFTGHHGKLNRRPGQQHQEAARFLEDDPEYPLVQALEVERVRTNETTGKEEYSYPKADIFTKRVREPRRMPDTASGPAEAVAVSLGYTGRIDLATIGRLLCISEDEAARQISQGGRAFQDPISGQFQTRERYLSGNVRRKLREAREAAEQGDDRFTANVAALEAAQPADVAIGDIPLNLGAHWIPGEVLGRFGEHLFGTGVQVRYVRAMNGYSVQLANEGTPGNTTTWSTNDFKGRDLFVHALNGTSPMVQRNVGTASDPKMQQDKPATEAARAVVGRLKEQFPSWLKTSTATVLDGQSVQEVTAKAYNETNNSMVAPSYTGDYLALPGMSNVVHRLPHRLSVVARVLQEGSAVMAHGVGSGKTFSQIVLAMEMKRTGLARKPMIVVQKATIGQFARSFREAYPDARIMVANEKTFARHNRQRFISRIATGDFDAVVLTQPQFDRIMPSTATVKAYFSTRLQALEDAIREASDKGGRRDPTTKQLEAAKKRLEAKLERLLDGLENRADDVIEFEKLGVDALLIDEAHAYKKISLITNLRNVKGIPSDESQRAMALEMKVGQVQSRNQGRNVILASGTPITNSMAEAYVMLKLATPHVLKEYGIENFDDFAQTFGATQTKLEFSWAGSWKLVTRFNKFVGGPELVTMIRAGFDVKMGNKELGLKVPKMRGTDGADAPELVVVPQSRQMDAVTAWLMRVADRYEKEPEKNDPAIMAIPITTMQAGMAAALDPRLIFPDMPDSPDSKVNHAVRRVLEIYHATAAERGTQVIFADRFKPMNVSTLRAFIGGEVAAIDVDDSFDEAGETETPAPSREDAEFTSGGFNLYHDIKAKLLAAGIPADEVALIHDAKSDKAREALFEKINAGKVRVILGSTEKLGVGVNMQQRLVAAHHLDPPRQMTPAMMEQRDGRIIRQGNPWAEVWNIRYGVEKSMDTGIYQMLENKQRFITQALTARGVGREFEDAADEVSLSMAEMKALLTGDPRVLRKAELDQRLQQMRSEKAGFENEQAKKSIRMASSRRESGGLERVVLPRAIADAAEFASAFPPEGDVSGNFSGKSAPDRESLVELIDSQLRQAAVRAKKAKDNTTSFRGTINGIPVEFQVVLSLDGNEVTQQVLNIQSPTDAGTVLRKSSIKNAVGAIASIRAQASSAQDRPAEIQRDIERKNAEAAELERALGEVWSRAEEFQGMEKELADIEASLLGKAVNAPAGGEVLGAARIDPNQRSFDFGLEDTRASGNQPTLDLQDNPPARRAESAGEAMPSVAELVMKNMGLAVSIANSYANIPGVDMDDIVGEARKALVKAARGFDPGRASFATYAGRAIRNTLNDLFEKGVRRTAREGTSADVPQGEYGDGPSLKDQLEDSGAGAAVSAGIEGEETRGALASAMGELPPQVREVLRLTGEGLSLSEVGEQLGFSKQNAQKILENGKRAMVAKLKLRGFEGVDPDGILYSPQIVAREIAEEADRIELGEQVAKEEKEKPQEYLKELLVRTTAGRMDALDYVVPGAKNLLTDAHIKNARISAALRTFREKIEENVKASFGYPSWWNRKNLDRLKRFTAELLPTAARLNAAGRGADGRFQWESFWMRAGEIGVKIDGAGRPQEQRAMGLNGVMITLRQGIFVKGRHDEVLRVGRRVDTMTQGRRRVFWQLERFIDAKQQAATHAAFHQKFPEAAHWLDSWIDPDLRESRVNVGGIDLPDFNRFSLHDFWGEISPFGEVGEVLGYTPDIYMTKSLVGMLSSRIQDLLNRTWTAPGREYKSGEARERGMVRNLFEGFNARAAEAHLETERRRLAENLLQKALKPIPDTGVSTNHVAWDTETIDQLLRSYHAAQGLDPAQYQRLKERVRKLARVGEKIDPNQVEFQTLLGELQEKYPTLQADQVIEFLQRDPQGVASEIMANDQPLLIGAERWQQVAAERWEGLRDARFSGDDLARIEKLAGRVAAEAAENRGKMIHRTALAELRRPLASQFINNRLLRIVDTGVRGATGGYLANPFTLVVNQLSNEVLITMHTLRRALYGLASLPFDRKQGKLGLYEAANLMRGVVTDRWYNKQVRELVPDELFDGNHRLNSITTDEFEKSPAELLREFNVSGAILKAMRYGEVDTRAKQRIAFASYLAHARIAYDEAKAAQKIGADVKKGAWMKDWIQNLAPDSVHRSAYYAATLVAMDYANVPQALDETAQVMIGGRDMTAEINLLRRALIPFSKFPYNLARQGKRYTFDSLREILPGNVKVGSLELTKGGVTSPAQRRQAAANLTMMTIMYLLARLMMDDDDEGVPQLGRSVDDLGKKLEGAYNTSGRINITNTPLGKTITAVLDMMGLHDLQEQDQWLRVRAFPYASSSVALATLANWSKATEDEAARTELEANVSAVWSDMVSEGVLYKIINALKGSPGPYDQGKNTSFILGETGFDVATGRFLPPPLLRTANALVDPMMRRNRPAPSLNYDPGVVEALQMKIPGAARHLPTSGRVVVGSEGSAKTEAALAETLARELPEGNFRRFTDSQGKAKVAYVMPSKVQARPRVLELFRAAGLNIRFMDADEYARELAAVE